MYEHVSRSDQIAPQPIGVAGVTIRPLWSDPATGAMTVVTEMAPGAVIPRHSHTHAHESVYVLDGEFVEAGVAHGPGTYFVARSGVTHGPHST
ncbi:MAG: cupin domain-containing protein, partial [Phycisphaerales bacterium]|nr:cupin domain-containing protein [Phycisphaerales bacterium]